MSKYCNFEKFMQSVIECADYKSQRRLGKRLYELYGVTEKSYDITKLILNSGWTKFKVVATMLSLDPVAFATALVAFMTNPIGIGLKVVLAIYGGIKAIRYLYDNRSLTIAIKKTGDSYKSSFDNNRENIIFIDQLIDDASENLVQHTL